MTFEKDTVLLIAPFDTSAELTVAIIYFVISILGTLGNIFVIFCIAWLPKLRTAQNLFILNLSLGNFILAINAVLVFVDELDAEWHLESRECRVVAFFTTLPPLAVVLSMVLVAYNRHSVITATVPGPTLSRPRVAIYLSAVWLVAILVSVPILVGWVSVKSGIFCACCIIFSQNLIYGITSTFFLYIIPNILIGFYYIRIYVFVYQSQRRVAHHQVVPQLVFPRTQGSQRTKRPSFRLALQFIVLFVIFNICYTPSMVVFWTTTEGNGLPPAASGAIQILFSMNLVLSPLVYFYFNKRARNELATGMCTCCKCKTKVGATEVSETQSNSQAGQSPPQALGTGNIQEGRGEEGAEDEGNRPVSAEISTIPCGGINSPIPAHSHTGREVKSNHTVHGINNGGSPPKHSQVPVGTRGTGIENILQKAPLKNLNKIKPSKEKVHKDRIVNIVPEPKIATVTQAALPLEQTLHIKRNCQSSVNPCPQVLEGNVSAVEIVTPLGPGNNAKAAISKSDNETFRTGASIVDSTIETQGTLAALT